MKIEVSNGEIIDKLTILEIKLEKITDEEKLTNIRKEHAILSESAQLILDRADPLYQKLYEINRKLWDIEDRCREFESKKDFGPEFIATVRKVYVFNDERADIKKRINVKTGSDLTEEKSYEKY
jgi:hypothetical protein